jgi:phage shock protein C
MERKLYRSSTDRMIAGVCGGLAEYFGIDPTWVRIGAVVLILGAGCGLLIYIICAFVIPNKPMD